MRIKINEKEPQFITLAITTLLLLYPVLALIVHNLGNAILLLLLILALLALALRLRPSGLAIGTLFRKYWPLHLAMISACVAIFLSQAWHGHFAIKFYDRALRLCVFPLVFWVLFFVPNRYLKLLQWSFLAATLIAAGKAYVFTKGGIIREGTIGYLSIIAYSDITLLTGVLSLASFGWNDGKNKLLFLFKLFVCVVGIYVSMLTATRGSLVAVPFFIVFFMFFSAMKTSRKWLSSCLMVVVLVSMFSISDTARNRFLNTGSEVRAYSEEAGKITSTGIRLQLWIAALKLFAREPIFGIGRENYDLAIKEMVAKKEVTVELLSLAHSHNEILFNMVVAGVFGLLSTLSIYCVPGYYFGRELNHSSGEIRTAAKMGCLLVIGFFAFGLTDLMFFWPTLGGYYALMVGAIFVFIIKEKNAARNGNPLGIVSPSRNMPQTRNF